MKDYFVYGKRGHLLADNKQPFLLCLISFYLPEYKPDTMLVFSLPHCSLLSIENSIDCYVIYAE